jgi:hypothetical protein
MVKMPQACGLGTGAAGNADDSWITIGNNGEEEIK